MSYKGKFRPTNRTKYKGDPDNIIYRSLWERQVMKDLDLNVNFHSHEKKLCLLID